jgi:hydroxymethylpyrimidine/phosphomethylpyrimidine kinase
MGPARPPRVLVCAGLDPGGGAGLLADLEALAAAGARGWAVATALTAQGARGARAMEPVPVPLVLAQIDALLDGERERPRAVKTGMLGNAAVADALAERLGARDLARAPLVVDPVLAATSGLRLLDPGRRSPAAALERLLARAALATPNWPELEWLAGHTLGGEEEAIRAARALPARAVLVKGGHREGAPVDLLVRGRTVIRVTGRRRAGSARGTGCRLASAIAGLLARRVPLEEAVRRAKRAVEAYLDASGSAPRARR